MKNQNFKYLSLLKLFLFCFTMYTKETCSELIKKMGSKRPLRLVNIKKTLNKHELNFKMNFNNLFLMILALEGASRPSSKLVLNMFSLCTS